MAGLLAALALALALVGLFGVTAFVTGQRRQDEQSPDELWGQAAVTARRLLVRDSLRPGNSDGLAAGVLAAGTWAAAS